MNRQEYNSRQKDAAAFLALRGFVLEIKVSRDLLLLLRAVVDKAPSTGTLSQIVLYMYMDLLKHYLLLHLRLCIVQAGTCMMFEAAGF